jgi:hypothetical protein
VARFVYPARLAYPGAGRSLAPTLAHQAGPQGRRIEVVEEKNTTRRLHHSRYLTQYVRVFGVVLKIAEAGEQVENKAKRAVK